MTLRQPTGLLGHYIILNNGILKSNSSIIPRSEGYITQYTPYGVYGLIVDENNEGTPSGKGLYLTVYPESSPNTDIISF